MLNIMSYRWAFGCHEMAAKIITHGRNAAIQVSEYLKFTTRPDQQNTNIGKRYIKHLMWPDIYFGH